ncbi:MAG: thioredoxin family protein [Verrucomicrobiota bacterium]
MRNLILLFALSCTAFAADIQSTATLIPEVSSVAPGKPFKIALKLEHPEGWHGYYLNSGGVELPPSITWKLPEGATAGSIQWPTPQVKDGFSGKSFIYSGSPVFLVEITPPAAIAAGSTFTFSAEAEWQICDKSCINEKASFSLNLPVAAEAVIDPAQAGLFETARQSIPKTLPDEIVISANPDKSSPDSIRFEFKGLKARPTDFIPNEPYLKALSDGGEIVPIEDGFLLKLDRKKVDFLDEPIPQANAISGILVGPYNYLIPETNISQPAPENVPFGKLFKILGGMFIGGLILNLMPCVFPVIGLKIMGFVQQAGENRRSIALHGISFASGVLASFAVLSGILFAARTAAIKDGSALKGWGYQLQDPNVVVVLVLLMFILGLNMFGLFEMGTSATSVGGKLQNKSGHTGSFFSGVLATVVATPCSAPFLGVAIGATMALPAVQFFTGFTAMALGLALPYLVLSIFPSLIDKLPRPGAWMESFKQAMSFLLFGTAGYLLWVYSGLIGQEYLLSPIFGLCLIAIAGWVYGRWHLPHRSKKARIFALTVSIISICAGILLTLPPKPSTIEWQPWSEEKTETLISEGTPVYIDFTAQWCVTCQVNKKVAYTDDVVSLAKKKGIVFLRADKTRPDPAIEAKLKELGRTAIPVNVLMIPGKELIITPEILTSGFLTELFNKVPDPAKENP